MIVRPAPLLALLLAAPLAAIGAARAAPGPVLFPAQDAEVHYLAHRAAGGDQPVVADWSAGMQRLRLGMAGKSAYVIVDFRDHHVLVVNPAARVVMDMPLHFPIAPGPLTVPPDTKVVAAGSASVAGQSCTVWRATSPHGTGILCVTDDGIPLHVTGAAAQGPASGGDLEATAVHRGPEPQSLFTIPSGYRNMDMAHMAGAHMAGPPPGAPQH